MELPLIALRFVRLADGGHLDLATGVRVALRVAQVSPAERLAFDASGRALMRVWHPGLAQYLDYGPLGTDRWFEASAVDDGSDDAITRVRARCWRTLRRCCRSSTPRWGAFECAGAHVCCRSAGRAGRADGCAAGLRGDNGAPACADRSPACNRLLERLDDRRSPGVTVWQVAAAPGLGWRTCWRLLRASCVRPATSPGRNTLTRGAIRRRRPPWLAHLAGATVVTPIDSEDPTDMNALLLALGARVGQTILIRVARGDNGPGATDRLEPLTSDQLEAAVICAEPSLPHRRLRPLAIRAEGRPGDFAAALVTAASRCGWPSQVHDGVAPLPSLSRAMSEPSIFVRAQRLAADGRPGSARLLLRRQGGALLRRGNEGAGLRVWAQLAVSLAASGRQDEADRTWNAAWRRAVDCGEPGPVVDVARIWPRRGSRIRRRSEPRRFSKRGRGVAQADLTRRARSAWARRSWQGRWRDALGALVDVAGCHAASLARGDIGARRARQGLPEAAAAARPLPVKGTRRRSCSPQSRDCGWTSPRGSPHRAFTIESLEQLTLGCQALELERVLTLAEAHVAVGERIPTARVPALRRCARGGVLAWRGPSAARAVARFPTPRPQSKRRHNASPWLPALAPHARCGAFSWRPRRQTLRGLLWSTTSSPFSRSASTTRIRRRRCSGCAPFPERTAAAGTIVLTSLHGSLVTLRRTAVRRPSRWRSAPRATRDRRSERIPTASPEHGPFDMEGGDGVLAAVE